jgi:hypothetical protein
MQQTMAGKAVWYPSPIGRSQPREILIFNLAQQSQI